MATCSFWRESSDSLTELFAAHAKALGELRNAPHTAANHFARKGRDGKPIANYADLATVLDTVRPALSKHNLSITQSFAPYHENGVQTWMLVTTLGHASGQFIRSYLPIQAGSKPQELAAAATYYKRIQLCALVGIASEDDDDGEVATRAVAVAQAPETSQMEGMAIKALNAAKTAKDREALVAKAQGYVSAGKLSPESLLRIQSHRQTLDAAEAEAADMQPEQPEQAEQSPAKPTTAAGKGKRQPAEAAS